MKAFLFFIATLFTVMVQAYVVPVYQDIKPASQVMLERQDFGTPIASIATHVWNGVAGPTSAAELKVWTFAAQPDVARNLVVTPGGTTADVNACVIAISGTNYLGKLITETFTFTAGQSTAVTGNKAFKTVTFVWFPAGCEQGTFAATWSVGVGEKIGLKRCMENAGGWFHSTAAGVKETTAATITASASDVSLNTADFNGTMNGSNQFIGYFVQNFACLP